MMIKLLQRFHTWLGKFIAYRRSKLVHVVQTKGPPIICLTVLPEEVHEYMIDYVGKIYMLSMKGDRSEDPNVWDVEIYLQPLEHQMVEVELNVLKKHFAT